MTKSLFQRYQLSNYHLTAWELLHTPLVSKYAIRHWNESCKNPSVKWGHRAICLIQFCPIVGFFASASEAIIVIIGNAIASSLTANQRNDQLPNRISRNIPSQYLWIGNQLGCRAPINRDMVNTIIENLRKTKEEGIEFNECLTNEISGGTCSAMALEFIDQFLKKKKASPNLDEATIIKSFTDFKTSNEIMKIRQAAFNEIQVTNRGIDFKRNKIQSLANYHGLKINFASEEIILSETPSEADKKVAENLNPGIYLIRSITPCENHKGEVDGHSMVFIKKNKEECFFYDPNFGPRKTSNAEILQSIFNSVKSWGRFHCRFYRFA
jgi:hypothetical protein